MEDYKVYQVVINTPTNSKPSQILVKSNETIEETLREFLNDYNIEGNNCVGHINNLDTFKQIIEVVKKKGFYFSIRDSDVRRKKAKTSEAGKDDEVPDQHSIFYRLAALPIRFFGYPFTVQKTTHYHCAYGSKYYKSKVHKEEDPINGKLKRKRNTGSKKIGCVAKMTLKSITFYPQYKLEVENDWRNKRKLIETLRKDLGDKDNKVEKIQRYYISMSVQSSHNHPPILLEPKIPKPKKPRIQSSITKRMKPEDVDNNWEDDGDYPSPSLSPGKDQTPTHKVLNLQDENFFHTLVKYPATGSNQVEGSSYKPVTIEFPISDFDQEGGERTIQVHHYQMEPNDLYGAQLVFREKLKKLYSLSENCGNASLIMKLASNLEEIEEVLNNEIEGFASYE